MAAPQPNLSLLRRHPLATICGGIALVVLGAFVFRYSSLDDAKELLAQQQGKAESIHRNIRNATELPEHLAALQSGVTRLEEKLMRSGDVAAYQQFFFKLETDSGVKIVRLQPTATSRPGQGKQAGTYLPLGFDITVEGTFPDVVRFSRNLESSARYFRLGSFSVRRGGGTGQSNIVTLIMGLELLGSQ
jgi:hypothetical protein